MLATPPATVEPALAGVWRWRDAAVLRFEPSGGFPMASQYTVALIPDRLLAAGQRLAGKKSFEVRTDPFLVEGVDAFEEPVPEGKGRVLFRGTLRFNVAVNPEQLAPLIKLVDPRGGPPIAVEIEATWPQTGLGFHTGPVEKTREERTVTLVIDAASPRPRATSPSPASTATRSRWDRARSWWCAAPRPCRACANRACGSTSRRRSTRRWPRST